MNALPVEKGWMAKFKMGWNVAFKAVKNLSRVTSIILYWVLEGFAG